MIHVEESALGPTGVLAGLVVVGSEAQSFHFCLEHLPILRDCQLLYTCPVVHRTFLLLCCPCGLDAVRLDVLAVVLCRLQLEVILVVLHVNVLQVHVVHVERQPFFLPQRVVGLRLLVLLEGINQKLVVGRYRVRPLRQQGVKSLETSLFHHDVASQQGQQFEVG